MDQSGDDTCQLLPKFWLKFDVDQSAIATCHMCHVAVRPTPVRPSRVLWEPTHPPTTHHLPGCFWEVPRVFGSSRDVRGSSGCFWEVPGVFGKFRVFLGSSGCFWEVPRVCLESSGCFWEVPRVFWEVPARFWKFLGVLESCRVLGPKNTFCDHSFAKNSDQKQKLVISDRCSMLNLREFEVGAPNPKQATWNLKTSILIDVLETDRIWKLLA